MVNAVGRGLTLSPPVFQTFAGWLLRSRRVLDRERLLTQRIELSYRPSRKGKRMWRLLDKRSLRFEYIRALKKPRQAARRVLSMWRMGDMSVPYPQGAIFPIDAEPRECCSRQALVYLPHMRSPPRREEV
jgi:hypothetical protein